MNNDLISRQAVLDAFWKLDVELRPNAIDAILTMVNNIPSVNPQEPKTGYWILDESDNSITCDKCGCRIYANDIDNGDAHYCPNCGARMVGE